MMRLIKTFILRLYTDLELPEQFCGNLQGLSRRKALPFKNSEELIDIVRRLAKEEVKDSRVNRSQTEKPE
jgi:hypothetical protein